MANDKDFTSEYLDYLSAVRGVAERTTLAYSRDLRHFTDYCANHDFLPEKATAHEVRHFIADLSAEGVASVSVNRAL